MRLQSIKAYDAGNTLVDSYTYGYDAASQRTSETTPNWVRKFEYDQQRQLTAAYRLASGSPTAHDTNYDYSQAFDPIGNRLTASVNAASASGFTTAYTPNNLNQYTSIAQQGQTATQPAYDANGNLTSDGSQTYAFDDDNRLTKVTRNGVDSVSVYDALCRRVAYKKQRGATITAETRFIYDGWNPVAELDGNNIVTRRYTWGLGLGSWGLDLCNTPQCAGGVGGLLAMTNVPSGTNAGSYIYNYDGNGDITSLVKEADQTLVARYAYGPFGETVSASGAMASSNPFQFSTKHMDAETGLLYYGYRYYQPSTGRWLSRDPLGERGGLNLYGYTENNPVNRTDPTGEISPIIVGGAVFAVVAAVAYVVKPVVNVSNNPGPNGEGARTVGPVVLLGPDFRNQPLGVQESMLYHESIHQGQSTFRSQESREMEAYLAERDWLKARIGDPCTSDERRAEYQTRLHDVTFLITHPQFLSNPGGADE